MNETYYFSVTYIGQRTYLLEYIAADSVENEDDSLEPVREFGHWPTEEEIHAAIATYLRG